MALSTINVATGPPGPALEVISPRSGTYALILHIPEETELEVGRLDRHTFDPGYYVYFGSAFGPGGLRARLAHHLKVAKRPHWHFDYLKTAGSLVEIWFAADNVRREHTWAATMNETRGASPPVKGFGSSDCRCHAHLFRLARKPRARTLFRRLRARDARHPPIKVLQLAGLPGR